MTALRVGRRVAQWIDTETRADAWVSYGAFAVALAACGLALRSF